MIRPRKVVVVGVEPLLVGVAAARTGPDLELRAIAIHAFRHVQAHRSAVGLDLPIREGPLLRVGARARLESNGRAICIRRRRHAKSCIISGLEQDGR